MADVELKKIDLSATEDIEAAVQEIVNKGEQHGYKLNSTFCFEHVLVLVFLKDS